MIRQLGIPLVAGVAALVGLLLADNFAGGGGASLGIEQATGRCVDVALNHDEHAIRTHALNHPTTVHYQQDIHKVSPIDVAAGRRVGLAWFSPDCTHFSRAKGSKPVSRQIRGLAWQAARWADEVRPLVIVLENVPEFEDWGPVDADGQVIAAREGETFRRFVARLRAAGYVVEWRRYLGCDFGARTTRDRFYLIARCDGQPIVWPEPTHGHGRLPVGTFASCVDWSIPCPSIFLTRAEVRAQRLRCKRPLADDSLARIFEGFRRFVMDDPQPFIAPITAPDDRHADLALAWVVKNYTGVIGHRLDRPIGAITSIDHHAIGVAYLVKYYGAATGQVQRLDEPLHTITSRARFGLVLVTVDAVTYRVIDIGYRMVAPRELARAQGFPDDYQFPGTKAQQIDRIGNSVCPPVAKAIVRAQFANRSLAA